MTRYIAMSEHPVEITSFHAHVYSDPSTREAAARVREGMLAPEFCVFKSSFTVNVFQSTKFIKLKRCQKIELQDTKSL